jgi:hypothetical protein
MGTQKLSEFKDDLRSALGRTPDELLMTRWVNNAQKEFGYAFKFPELMASGYVDTVNGTSEYALPGDFRAFSDDGVRITSPVSRAGGILTAETRTEYLRTVSYSGVFRGAPEAYHKFGGKLVLRPGGDSTVTRASFDYWKKITPLTNANDITVFDEDWDDVTFRGALYRGHLNYGEHDRMLNVFNMFLSLIRSRVLAEDLEEFPEGGISAIQSQYDNLMR